MFRNVYSDRRLQRINKPKSPDNIAKTGMLCINILYTTRYRFISAYMRIKIKIVFTENNRKKEKKEQKIQKFCSFQRIEFCFLYIVAQNRVPASEQQRDAPYPRESRQSVEYPGKRRALTPKEPRDAVKPEYSDRTPVERAYYN